MASKLDIFYQIFSWKYSIEELREKFSSGGKVALVGSKDDVATMLELIGEPVINLSNLASHSQIRLLPLPDRRHSPLASYQNLNVAIIHLGQSVPSLEYLRFCCDTFSAQTKLLFLADSTCLEGTTLAPIMGRPFSSGASRPNFVSEAEAKRLAAQALAQTKKEPLEQFSPESQSIRPAWLASGHSVSNEPQVEELYEEQDEERQLAGSSLAEVKNNDWESKLLATWPKLDKEPRLGPAWKSSHPLAAYIVSPINTNIVELVPRFDSTLPSIIVLRKGDGGASFYECIVRKLGALAYTLARDYSLLRENIVSYLITKAAQDSAAAALASGFTTSLPFVGAFLGLVAVSGETIYITAKQLHLALIIGAIYARPIDFGARIGELLPVVGGAWGWRILAREAVGLMPALGPLAKAAVAWSGTYTVGKLSCRFYQQGEQHLSDEYREYIDTEAKYLARQAALDCLKNKP